MTGMTTHAVVPTLVLPTIRNQSSGPVLAVELPSSSESRAKIPLLFITGYAGVDLLPGSEVIDKPFDLDTLARKVQAALAAR